MGAANEAMNGQYLMREPCRWCLRNDQVEVLVGYIAAVNGQDVVRCKRCERHCYNAPRSETGKPQRSIRSRPEISFGLREYVLQRDGGRCFLCGRDPRQHGVVLHLAHALSVADARVQGIENEDWLYSENNLFAACEECNLGMRGVSVPPRLLLAICRANMRRGGYRQ